MGTKHGAIGSSGDENPKLLYQFLEDDMKRVFTLIVTSRMPHSDSVIKPEFRPTPKEYELLIPRTIAAWSKIMLAYLTNTKIASEDDIMPVDAIKREGGSKVVPSDLEPYVTVWNYGLPNAPEITMNSGLLPSDVLAQTRSHVMGIANWNKYCSAFGMVRISKPEIYSEPSITLDTPANVTTLPKQTRPQEAQSNNSKSFPFTPDSETYIKRSIYLAGAETHIQLQKGKRDDNKYEKPALIITEENRIDNMYDVQFDDNQYIALHITGSLKVKKIGDNLAIVIPIEHTKYPFTVWIGYDDSFWQFKNLRDTLGIPKERDMDFEAGQELYLDDECYLVLSCSSTDKDGKPHMKDGKPIQYKNFYNLYYAPSGK